MNGKRTRNRNYRSGTNSRMSNGQIPLNRNHVFDSHGPGVRVRGTAQQLADKYTQYARDANSSGDRVAAEGFYQFAEHYLRIVNAMVAAAQKSQQERQERHAARQQKRMAAHEERKRNQPRSEQPKQDSPKWEKQADEEE